MKIPPGPLPPLEPDPPLVPCPPLGPGPPPFWITAANWAPGPPGVLPDNGFSPPPGPPEGTVRSSSDSRDSRRPAGRGRFSPRDADFRQANVRVQNIFDSSVNGCKGRSLSQIEA